MLFFLSLLVDGVLAGAVYAPIALAFVVVYKASRMINFALGEWAMVGSRLVASGVSALGLGLAGALGFACAGMAALGLAFNRLVLRPLVGRPLISLIMVTLGAGAVMRGGAPFVFADIPAGIPMAIPHEPVVLGGVPVASDKLAAGAVGLVCVAAVGLFFRLSRTGVALRALADDQQAAMAVGVDIHRYFSLTWTLVGALSVCAGTLWSWVSGGGFGMVLVGLKVFPIVIIGGLDSIAGAIVGAVVVGVLESLAAGYLDPHLGGGFSNIASYLVLIALLFARPYGLFGRPAIERV
ncbi:MAG TPA: branched-chain amino acid ABC transporter permease [Candidatus Methylomirabilis sp.]|nr:branched-chain amino acid ABC transporter permease [Candidatus Methylomirabilis sp.]